MSLLRYFVFFGQDPEPEKLEVPPQMLHDTFLAARDVMHNAKSAHHSSGSVDDKDGPLARRRFVCCSMFAAVE